ncbi:unnamed protein product [Ectocarpus sp. 12 AP-2014]
MKHVQLVPTRSYRGVPTERLGTEGQTGGLADVLSEADSTQHTKPGLRYSSVRTRVLRDTCPLEREGNSGFVSGRLILPRIEIHVGGWSDGNPRRPPPRVAHTRHGTDRNF